MKRNYEQGGFGSILAILLLVIGVGLGTYLVQTRTNLFPKADTGACDVPGYDTNVDIGPIVNEPTNTTVKRVFVSSSGGDHGGDLKTAGSSVGLGAATSGLDGADKLCQSLANKQNLGGAWKAWLSDSTGSPSTRFIKSGLGYKKINGEMVVNSWSDLESNEGGILAAINIDEMSHGVEGTRVWSNTLPNGEPKSLVKNCNNWTSSTNGDVGEQGNPNSTDNWAEGPWSASCNVNLSYIQNKLYCFEQ